MTTLSRVLMSMFLNLNETRDRNFPTLAKAKLITDDVLFGILINFECKKSFKTIV